MKYGLLGIRADVVRGDSTKLELFFEMKTGFFSYISEGEAQKYFDNIPLANGPALVLIKVR